MEEHIPEIVQRLTPIRHLALPAPEPKPIRHHGRPAGLHFHYKTGKEEFVIELGDIVKRVEAAYLELEPLAYFWLLYWTGIRKSEGYELTIPQVTVTDTKVIIDIGARKKHSARTQPLELMRFWPGIEAIVQLYNIRKDFRTTIRAIDTFHTENKVVIRTVVMKTDKWLFLNIRSTTAWRIVKGVLGPTFYPHFLRLNRITEIGSFGEANIVMLKSFSGIKSIRVLEKYLGQSEKQLRKAESILGQIAQAAPNIVQEPKEPKPE